MTEPDGELIGTVDAMPFVEQTIRVVEAAAHAMRDAFDRKDHIATMDALVDLSIVFQGCGTDGCSTQEAAAMFDKMLVDAAAQSTTDMNGDISKEMDLWVQLGMRLRQRIAFILTANDRRKDVN